MATDEGRWKIGQVAERAGLTTRTLRYYEDLGLLTPSARLASGHRVYTGADLARLYRICLLRRLGMPLSDIAAELTDGGGRLTDTVDRHLNELDLRLAALGRHRERVLRVHASVQQGDPTDEELLEVLGELPGLDAGLTQRVTLLVYEDIEAVHDHLVAVFGFGPGRITRDASGVVRHGELHVGDGVVWMHPPSAEAGLASPVSVGVATHCMAVMVSDADAHYERSVSAGARIVYPPREMDYGYREYAARDPEGGLWSFMTPLP